MNKLFTNKFERSLAKITLKLQQLLFYKIAQKTLFMIFPFVLIGSFLKIIQAVILSKDGFIGTLLPSFEDNWLVSSIIGVTNNLSNLTLGFVSVLATFGAAKYTAKHFKRDDQLAGLTSMIALLIISYIYSKSQPLSFHNNLLGIRGTLFAILLGMFVGWIFKQSSPEIPHKHLPNFTSNILQRTFISLRSILIVILIAALFSALVNVAYYSHLPDEFMESLANNYQSNNSGIEFLKISGIALYTIIMSFLGWSGPYSPLDIEKSDPNILDNLYYALNHHTAWGAPHDLTSNSLYHAFATFGGAGSTLALIIAIFLVSRDPDFQTVAKWTMIPSVFNINSGIMTGIPVMFNIVFLIPFIMAPLISMLIAAVAISLHLMPPCVYPIPSGTPGPLIAFIGTNGSWQALVFTLIDIAVSVYIYIPFVKIAEKLKKIDNLAIEEGDLDD
ncbi:PTS transporter subunit EIIC [Companilactobacillus keshanensis]|uniref:Permease IIC component n=1 Tax=Companilactobacillus keshanensis TaxID=2486003 RepID=A0ABW4BYI2_9LACO|nr:PTS transporter subunit EIIC [Companilactobacillus keshanensis]